MTQDSAGIVERLREHATALREKASYTYDIDANRLGAQADECDKAAAHIEAQAVELERMADLVRRAQQNTPDHYVNWHEDARAALTPKDAG
jgi:hypothetical protein